MTEILEQQYFLWLSDTFRYIFAPHPIRSPVTRSSLFLPEPWERCRSFYSAGCLQASEDAAFQAHSQNLQPFLHCHTGNLLTGVGRSFCCRGGRAEGHL